jgi:hypothetical protein
MGNWNFQDLTYVISHEVLIVGVYGLNSYSHNDFFFFKHSHRDKEMANMS